MKNHPSKLQIPLEQTRLEQPPTTVAQLPVANAVAAVLIAVAALLGAIAVLLVMPGELEALGTAVTIAGSGFALAAKIAVPRSN
ncbi:hypothetical protein [Streptomyces chartreusis]|uniref:hypothetical protein n=1 Tax=Streptomyces chartreusis TaxID=1969 RepID=UPI002E82204E|nr:hypothetical protein [Streptomyces chartreusis]WUB23239.1 hypothetical protein OG997_44030 [Streptomyces chartreusis]